MSLVVAFILAAAVPSVPADAPRAVDRGAQVESARIAVTNLRPAVLKGGVLSSDAHGPRSQRHAEGGAVTYAFE
jgi:hypothetical protein